VVVIYVTLAVHVAIVGLNIFHQPFTVEAAIVYALAVSSPVACWAIVVLVEFVIPASPETVKQGKQDADGTVHEMPRLARGFIASIAMWTAMAAVVSAFSMLLPALALAIPAWLLDAALRVMAIARSRKAHITAS